VQTERRGTAHAVLAARTFLERGFERVLVLFCRYAARDSGNRERHAASLDQDGAVSVLGFDTPMPDDYGRVLIEGDQVVAIREHKDATPS